MPEMLRLAYDDNPWPEVGEGEWRPMDEGFEGEGSGSASSFGENIEEANNLDVYAWRINVEEYIPKHYEMEESEMEELHLHYRQMTLEIDWEVPGEDDEAEEDLSMLSMSRILREPPPEEEEEEGEGVSE